MLEAVSWRFGDAGKEIRRPTSHLFLFIGADPNTDWLKGSGVGLDPKRFILTGEDAGDSAIRWRRRGAVCSQSVTCGQNQ
jgi:thioredoxin reductase (NADPH)